MIGLIQHANKQNDAQTLYLCIFVINLLFLLFEFPYLVIGPCNTSIIIQFHILPLYGYHRRSLARTQDHSKYRPMLLNCAIACHVTGSSSLCDDSIPLDW